MIKYLFVILPLITGCYVKDDIDLSARINQIKYMDSYKIKRGFFNGCSFVVTGRSTYYTFTGDVNCPQNPSVTLLNIPINAEDFI